MTNPNLRGRTGNIKGDVLLTIDTSLFGIAYVTIRPVHGAASRTLALPQAWIDLDPVEYEVGQVLTSDDEEPPVGSVVLVGPDRLYMREQATPETTYWDRMDLHDHSVSWESLHGRLGTIRYICGPTVPRSS